MSRRLAAAVSVALVVVAAMSGCSSSGAPAARASSPSATRSPASSTSASPTAPASSPTPACPELVADVPADLTHRRLHPGQDMGTPTPFGVIWSGRTNRASRVLNIGSAPSDEEFGDGTDVEPVLRRVHGTRAEELVVGGVRRVSWKEPAATACAFWTVTSQGLSAQELEAVLDSVRESP